MQNYTEFKTRVQEWTECNDTVSNVSELSVQSSKVKHLEEAQKLQLKEQELMVQTQKLEAQNELERAVLEESLWQPG